MMRFLLQRQLSSSTCIILAISLTFIQFVQRKSTQKIYVKKSQSIAAIYIIPAHDALPEFSVRAPTTLAHAKSTLSDEASSGGMRGTRMTESACNCADGVLDAMASAVSARTENSGSVSCAGIM
jgi:hypothetical protein